MTIEQYPINIELPKHPTDVGNAAVNWELGIIYKAIKKLLVGIMSGVAAPKYNYLYNGHWHIDQVNEGVAYSVAGGGGDSGIIKCMDGFSGRAVGAGTFTVTRVTDPDNAAKKACKIVCTVNDATMGAGDLYYVEWPLEGSAVTDLELGTPTAKIITIKFKASFAVVGTYGVCLANSAESRVCVGTIDVQTTAEMPYTVTMQLDTDTAGTWVYAAATIGMRVRLTLAAGSNFKGTAGVWGPAQTFTTSAQANFMATATTNIIYIKPIQLVEGTVAGDIMPQSYDEALWECQRFYEKSWNSGVAVGTVTQDGREEEFRNKTLAIQQYGAARFKRTKAANPTITVYNDVTGTVNNGGQDDGSDVAVTVAFVGMNGFRVSWTNGAGKFGAAFHWTADSRL